MLDRNGYRVLTAATGRDAVDIVTGQQGHIDVLLTDVVLPKMLGQEVADRIGAVQPPVRCSSCPVTPNDGELRSGLGGQAPASACRDRMATEIR